MSIDRQYFLVDSDGPTRNVIAAAIEIQKQFWIAIRDLKIEFQADSIMTYSSTRFAGLGFDAEIPEGWKKLKNGLAVADGKTKPGKLLKQRLKSLPSGIDCWRFSSMLTQALGGDYSHWEDNHVYFSTFEPIGNQHVLSVPAPCNANPPGTRLLKMSEYWQLKEETKEPGTLRQQVNTLQQQHERDAAGIARLKDWIKAANQFAWAHDCPAQDGGSACTCGLDEFLGRPKPFIESYKQQLAEVREDAQRLEQANTGLHVAIEDFWVKQCGEHACGCEEFPECTHTLNAAMLRKAAMALDTPIDAAQREDGNG